MIWSLRRDMRDFVAAEADGQIGIRVNGSVILCDRATARLLAKRISQCLDATKARTGGQSPSP